MVAITKQSLQAHYWNQHTNVNVGVLSMFNSAHYYIMITMLGKLGNDNIHI